VKPEHDIQGGTDISKKGKRKRSLPKLDVTTVWNDSCEQAFQHLKSVLSSTPLLGHPDFTKTFILEIDASFLGLGAVLSQQQDQGLVVLGYASRGLRKNERNMENYSSMKLELLGLKWAITDKFRDLLLGAQFIVYTDNNPLSYLQTTAKLGATETRWAAELAQFNFTIKYRSGKSNANADALSRKTNHGEPLMHARLQEIHMPHNLQVCSPLSTSLPEDLRLQIQATTADVWLNDCENSASYIFSTAFHTER
jgi:hypothetical protein